MTEQSLIDQARSLLADPLPAEPLDLVAQLAAASEKLAAVLDEAMAAAALAGASGRLIAEAAGIAPNTVPPRLARSAALSEYAEAGKVGAGGIAAARYLQRAASPDGAAAQALTFTPRKRRQSS